MKTPVAANDSGYSDCALPGGEIVECACQDDMILELSEMLDDIKARVLDVVDWIDECYIPQIKTLQANMAKHSRRLMIVRCAMDLEPIDVRVAPAKEAKA